MNPYKKSANARKIARWIQIVSLFINVVLISTISTLSSATARQIKKVPILPQKAPQEQRAQGTVFQYPKGAYGMSPYSTPLYDENGNGIAQNPGLVGILLSIPWYLIEAEEGVFVWDEVDQRLIEAQEKGLKAAFNLCSSPKASPEWVKANAVETIYIYSEDATYPTFWDPYFYQKKKAFIQAAGARYSGNPAVVAVMASFANMNTNDWYIPHAPPEQKQAWKDAGYTTARMIEIGKDIIDTTANAFPRQNLKLPISPTYIRGYNEPDVDDYTLATEVVDYVYTNYPDRFYIQVNKLCTTVLTADDPEVQNAQPYGYAYQYKMLADYSPQIGLQMLCGATYLGDGTPEANLLESINIGLTYTPHYMEFWQTDSLNPAFYQLFLYATRVMNGISTGPLDVEIQHKKARGLQ